MYNLDKNSEALINKHLQLVLKKNEKINLTAIKDIATAKIKHIEDSLSIIPYISNYPKGKIIDIGSGGGFPGIPVAIASKRHTTLVETVKKKAECLNYFVNELSVRDLITVYNGRIEDYSKEHKEEYSIVTARALSKITSLLELSTPLLRNNGILICYKSQNIYEEINNANKIEDRLGFKLNKIINIKLSDSTKRKLVIYKKIHPPLVKLPRKNGFAQKKPFY